MGWGGRGVGGGGPPNMHNTNLPVLFDTPLSCAETSVPLSARRTSEVLQCFFGSLANGSGVSIEYQNSTKLDGEVKKIKK